MSGVQRTVCVVNDLRDHTAIDEPVDDQRDPFETSTVNDEIDRLRHAATATLLPVAPVRAPVAALSP